MTGAESRLRTLRRAAALSALAIVCAPVVLLLSRAPAPRGGSAPVAGPSLETLEAAYRADGAPARGLDLAAAYLQAGRNSQAAPILEVLKRSDPADARVWNDVCVLHNQQGDFALAKTACEEAVRLAPSLQLARNNLAWSQTRLQALSAQIDALERTPAASRDAAFELERGMLLLHAGRYEPAVEAWRRGLDLDPRSAKAANDIGVARMLQNRPREALGWFTKAEVLDLGLQLAHGNEAWARQVLTERP